jgi:hypothetical protein
MVRLFLLGAKIHIAKQIARPCDSHQNTTTVRGRSAKIDQPSLNAIEHVHRCAGAKDGIAFRVAKIGMSADYQSSYFGRDVQIHEAAFEDLKAVTRDIKPFSARSVSHGAYEAIFNW